MSTGNREFSIGWAIGYKWIPQMERNVKAASSDECEETQL